MGQNDLQSMGEQSDEVKSTVFFVKNGGTDNFYHQQYSPESAAEDDIMSCQSRRKRKTSTYDNNPGPAPGIEKQGYDDNGLQHRDQKRRTEKPEKIVECESVTGHSVTVTAETGISTRISTPTPRTSLREACIGIAMALLPLVAYMNHIQRTVFATQQRLSARLRTGLNLVSSPPSVFDTTHLYVLRVCELLVASCLKPQVDRVSTPFDEPVQESIDRKMQFWAKPEGIGLISYLIRIFARVLEEDRQSLSILQLFKQLVSSTLLTSTSPIESILDSLIVGEEKVKELLSRRQKSLQRMISMATSLQSAPQTGGASAASASGRQEQDIAARVDQVLALFSKQSEAGDVVVLEPENTKLETCSEATHESDCQMQMSQASSEEFLNSAVAREAISSSSPTDFQVDSRKRKISHHDSISSTSLRMNEMTLE